MIGPPGADGTDNRGFRQHLVQRLQDQVDIVSFHGQWRPHLEDVERRPFAADQDSALPHSFLHMSSDSGSRCPPLTIGHEIDASEEPHSAHVTNRGMAGLECSKSREQSPSHSGRVLLKLLLFDDVEKRLADPAR